MTTKKSTLEKIQAAEAAIRKGQSSAALTDLEQAKIMVRALREPEPSPSAPRLFSPLCWVNRALASDAILSPKSAEYVTSLLKAVASPGCWYNSNSSGVPIYIASKSDPKVTVKCVKWSGEGKGGEAELDAAWAEVPKVATDIWKPAEGEDKHLTVWVQDADELVEFWGLREEGGGWVAAWGGRMRNVSTSLGRYEASSYPAATTNWGATATSIPLLAGCITQAEAEAQSIPHAVSLCLPGSFLSGGRVYPAQRADGAGGVIPEGSIIRLPAGHEAENTGLLGAIEAALATYGAVIRDQGGAVAFYGEDVSRLGGKDNGALLGGWPNQVLAKLPWAKVQFIKPEG